jgi:hypothetical protein
LRAHADHSHLTRKWLFYPRRTLIFCSFWGRKKTLPQSRQVETILRVYVVRLSSVSVGLGHYTQMSWLWGLCYWAGCNV